MWSPVATWGDLRAHHKDMEENEPGTISSLDWLADPNFENHPELPDSAPLFPEAHAAATKRKEGS